MPHIANKGVLEKAQLIFQDGLKCLQEGNVDNADLLFKKAYALDPKNIDTLNLLGIREYQKKNYHEAIHLLSKAHSLDGNSAQTLNNLGLAYNDLREFQKALEFFNLAISIDSTIAEIHNNRGNSLHGLNRYDLAIEAYKNAIQLSPLYAEAISNQGIIFFVEREFHKAIEYFKRAIQINPEFAPAHNGLGNSYTEIRDYESAFNAFEIALRINPEYLDAYLNFAISLKKAKKIDLSLECLQYAIEINPAHAKSYYLAGEILYDIAHRDAAIGNYQKSLRIDCNNMNAQFALTIAEIPKIASTTQEWKESREKFHSRLKQLSKEDFSYASKDEIAENVSRHPFYIAYQNKNNKYLLSQYGDVCTQHIKAIQEGLTKGTINSQGTRKIKIGIISHYFYDHPVWHAITKGWVKLLNPDLFELHILNTGGPEDEETLTAKKIVSGFWNKEVSIAAFAQFILDKDFDVLMYPEIGMDRASKALACFRLAPLQLASWGHPETTGLSTIDCFISSEDFEPISPQLNYREQLLILPGLGTYFEYQDLKLSDIDLSHFNLDPEKPILLCGGSPAKYSPENDWVLASIAKKLGSCQFVFFNFDEHLTAPLERRLKLAFEKYHLNYLDYYHLLPFLKKPEFYSLMRKAHLYLDTIGFSGFNTAMHSLACNLPIITREGQFMRGRFASGLLRRVGLNDLVCKDEEDFICRAVHLVNNQDTLNRLKDSIMLCKRSLFEDIEPVKFLEKFLIESSRHQKFT